MMRNLIKKTLSKVPFHHLNKKKMLRSLLSYNQRKASSPLNQPDTE